MTTLTAFFRKRTIRYSLVGLSFFGLVVALYLLLSTFWIGLLFSIGFVLLIGYAWNTERHTYMETENYIQTLSHRLKKVGDEALLKLPLGIILLDDENKVEWSNPYISQVFNKDTLIGEELFELSEQFQSVVRLKTSEDYVMRLGERSFQASYKSAEKLIYFFDITEQLEIEELYYADRTVLGIILVDNYDELAQGMDDQTRSQLNSLVTSLITKWGNVTGVYVKRISSDRFLAVLNESTLGELEKKKFSILDDIREATAEQSTALTLSIGIGAGSVSLIELGELAQSSLDLVLGRGGDQVAIKQANGKVRFYGGKTNPAEKRTRVRARVISHALRDLIQDSDRVFIMGHKNPDMDSIGAAIGVRKMARMNDIDGYVILNFNELNGSVTRLMNEIKKDESLYNECITADDALPLLTERSLVIIVDTHKPSMVIDERLLSKAEKVVVIDHHRRSEEFIDNPMLVYMEPYASSTAELVTELLEYQPKKEKLTMLESTALLAGIVVDTKSFTLRTGARTFEAASYLRAKRADTVLVQRLLKEDLNTYVERAKLVETAEVLENGIAIAKGQEEISYDSVLIAQTADILLGMQGITASFVIAPRADGKVGISARSIGDLNVQLTMEALGGGGHLTNAACQIEDVSVDEAVEQLKIALINQSERG